MCREDPFTVVSFRFPKHQLKTSKHKIMYPLSVQMPASTVIAEDPQLNGLHVLTPQASTHWKPAVCQVLGLTDKYSFLPDQKETSEQILRQCRMVAVCTGQWGEVWGAVSASLFLSLSCWFEPLCAYWKFPVYRTERYRLQSSQKGF